ncbi:hypothetical protein U1Q18_041146, partial [Sarracenia purpurea var. burkii]
VLEEEISIAPGNRAWEDGTRQGGGESEVNQALLEKREQIMDLTLPKEVNQPTKEANQVLKEGEQAQETIEDNP